MKKYIFEVELRKEYQREGYKHYENKITIVAENDDEAVEKLSDYKVSHGKIHFYSSDYKSFEIKTNDDMIEALKEEKESICNFNKRERQSIGLLVAAFGACIVETNLCEKPVKVDDLAISRIFSNKVLQELIVV